LHPACLILCSFPPTVHLKINPILNVYNAGARSCYRRWNIKCTRGAHRSPDAHVIVGTHVWWVSGNIIRRSTVILYRRGSPRHTTGPGECAPLSLSCCVFAIIIAAQLSIVLSYSTPSHTCVPATVTHKRKVYSNNNNSNRSPHRQALTSRACMHYILSIYSETAVVVVVSLFCIQGTRPETPHHSSSP